MRNGLIVSRQGKTIPKMHDIFPTVEQPKNPQTTLSAYDIANVMY